MKASLKSLAEGFVDDLLAGYFVQGKAGDEPSYPIQSLEQPKPYYAPVLT